METHDHLEGWVRQWTAASQPAAGWPDEAMGRGRLARRIARRRLSGFIVAASAAAAAVVLVVPGTRVAAQRLWDRVVVGRIQVLTADREATGFFAPEVYKRAETKPVASVDEAGGAAGFSPRLPGPGIFAASPTFSVADVTAARVELRTPGLFPVKRTLMVGRRPPPRVELQAEMLQDPR